MVKDQFIQTLARALPKYRPSNMNIDFTISKTT